ncbi:response regulator [Paenibacillus paeoniae]|uniref:Response regulator n=1 Tax=Paenibacillus paeoniae TaxID=2292705 RepID=A0A371PKW0_9BACL|nr:response regulator [Paenibacillus paeoniae]REK76841.1 response regulator [Paenibacillus paeoniae]
MLQAFLVDDEIHSMYMLKFFLLQSGQVEILGCYNNGIEATLQMTGSDTSRVWFVDIEMPGMSGLELAERIHQVNPLDFVVFTTAYDQYAIEAFELAAIDYLQKPMEMSRLMKTIDRLTKEIHLRHSDHYPATNKKLAVRMFGDFQVLSPIGKKLTWRTSKEKELFAYLLLNGRERVSRDKLIEELWPDEPFHKAKVYLHTCISLLRKNLRQYGLEEIIHYEKEGYYLDHMGQLSTDVAAFTAGIDRIKSLKESGISELLAVLEHYKNPLLDSEDYHWAILKAQQLEKSAVNVMLTIGNRYLAQEQYEDTIHIAEQAVVISPYEEEAYRLLMQSYYLTGKHDHVFQIYRKLVLKLAELSIQPSELSRRIYEKIC